MGISPNTALPIAKARGLLQKWMILDPSEIDLDTIAADLGLIIVERENIGSAARLVAGSWNGIISLDSSLREPGRKRFAIAHEIGHFVLHKSKNPIEMCQESDFFRWGSVSTFESEANAFAVEILMPTSLFSQKCGTDAPSLKHIAALAGVFQTSLTATAIRYAELGGFPCVLIVSRDSRVAWTSANQGFPYRVISPGSAVYRESVAAEFFGEGSVPSQPETVPGYAWIEDQEIGSRCFLYEEVLPLRSYNTTLSLVWIRQDDNRRSEDEKVDPHFTPDGKRYRW